jgi:hypothetical protein
MAFDEVNGLLVVFGGQGYDSFGNLIYYDDTWIFDGATWSGGSTSGTPQQPFAQAEAAMAWDGVSKKVLLYASGDCFQWTGNSWQLSASGPPSRKDAVMAWDPILQRVLLFGGYDSTGPGVLYDTWEWDGSTWTQRYPMHVPPYASGGAMAFDQTRGRIVYLSESGMIPIGTFEWTGTDWLTTIVAPPIEYFAGFAMSWTGQTVDVVSGGGNFYNDQEWWWNGAAWVNRPLTSGGPIYRLGATMAWDTVNRRALLFGGRGADNPSIGATYLNDLWELH